MQKLIVAFALTFALVHARPADPYSGRSAEAAAPIISQDTAVNLDGSFKNDYQTANGISVSQTGIPKDGPEGPFIAVQGSNAYTSPDGQVIQTQYIADENGYQPIGDHLPTPPPVPAEIARALSWLASLPSTPEPPAQAQSYRRY